MELQFNKTEHRCLTRVIRDMACQEVTQEIRLTDDMPDIGRVLSAWGQMVIRSKEWRGDMVTLVGGVMVWVLYAPEDGGEPRCVDAWIPYQLRWERLEGEREGIVRISPVLRFVDARTVAARKFMVRAGAAALAEALSPDRMELYSAAELPEDIEVLRRTYPIRLMKEAGERTFEMDEELSVPGHQVSRIISYTLCPEVTDRRVLSNRVVFRGKGNLHLVYRCGEGRIRTADFEVPFSQYGDLDAAYSPDAQADVWMAATGVELDLQEDGKLRLKCGLVGQYLVDDRELVELIEDAYSPRRTVGVHTQTLMMPALVEEREITFDAEQVVPGHSGEVVDIRFLPDLPQIRRQADQIEVDQPGNFQVMYTGEDGQLHCAVVRWEGHMTIPADECCRMHFRPVSVGAMQGTSGADGMALSAQLQVQISTAAESGIPMVTGLEIGETREADPGRPSLILCRPGKESLWSIARRCGSTVSAIEEANGFSGEIPGDRMILIPVS